MGKTGRPMEGTRDAGASSSSGPGAAPGAAAATGQTTGVGNEGSVREEKMPVDAGPEPVKRNIWIIHVSPDDVSAQEERALGQMCMGTPVLPMMFPPWNQAGTSAQSQSWDGFMPMNERVPYAGKGAQTPQASGTLWSAGEAPPETNNWHSRGPPAADPVIGGAATERKTRWS